MSYKFFAMNHEKARRFLEKLIDRYLVLAAFMLGSFMPMFTAVGKISADDFNAIFKPFAIGLFITVGMGAVLGVTRKLLCHETDRCIWCHGTGKTDK